MSANFDNYLDSVEYEYRISASSHSITSTSMLRPSRVFSTTLPNNKVTVHGIFEIPNSKHQIPNKSQILNTNDQNYFDFSRIDENIFFNSFASCIKLECSFFKIIYWYAIWNFGHWYLFVI